MNLQFNFIYLRPKRFFTILIFLEMTRPAKRQRLVISGSSHPELGELIAKKLSTQLGKCKMTKMSNGETHVDIQVYSGFKFRDFFIFFLTPQSKKNLSNRNLRFFLNKYPRAKLKNIFFRIRCETRLFMLSNQLAKMLMMPYLRCNYWVMHVKQLRLIQLLEFYLIYPIRDR